jgi:hypothetical protein
MEKKHDLIEQTLCKDLDDIEMRMKQGQKMEMKDYEILHHIYATLAKRATYNAMKEAEEYEDGEEGFSGRRGRAANGRYVSRDGGPSYSDGYSQGYAEAMSQMNGGNSGHYPMTPPYYPTRRY